MITLNNKNDWNALYNLKSNQLLALGFAIWDSNCDKNGKILMLIPGNFRTQIPNGFIVECINGESIIVDVDAKPGNPGYIDDECRWGYLAYGIRVTA